MVDFIKVTATNYLEIRNNTLLDFAVKVDTRTGEVSDWHQCECFGLKFESHDSGRLVISGSLHKYFNQGEHNHNQFTISDLLNVLTELEILFELSLSDFHIQNIEFGVNLLEIDRVKDVLFGLHEHKNEPFTLEIKERSYYRQCKHYQYFIKVYDKGKQYDLPNAVMRYELKYIKSRELQPYQLTTLEDLRAVDNWLNHAKLKLIEIWHEITFYDPCIDSNSNIKLSDYKNQYYWITQNKMRKSRSKKHLNRIIDSYPNNYKRSISDKINQTVESLRNVTNSPFKYNVIS